MSPTKNFSHQPWGGSHVVWVKHPGVVPQAIWCRGTWWVPIYGKVVVVAPPTSRASQLGWHRQKLNKSIFSQLFGCGFCLVIVWTNHLEVGRYLCLVDIIFGVNFGTLSLSEIKSRSMLKSGLSCSLLLACNSVTPSPWKFPKVQMAGSQARNQRLKACVLSFHFRILGYSFVPFIPIDLLCTASGIVSSDWATLEKWMCFLGSVFSFFWSNYQSTCIRVGKSFPSNPQV